MAVAELVLVADECLKHVCGGLTAVFAGLPIHVPRGQEQQEGHGALFPGNVGLRRGSWCGLGVPTTRFHLEGVPCPVLSRTAVDHPCLVGLMGSVLCWERCVASHPISVPKGDGCSIL